MALLQKEDPTGQSEKSKVYSGCAAFIRARDPGLTSGDLYGVRNQAILNSSKWLANGFDKRDRIGAHGDPDSGRSLATRCQRITDFSLVGSG